MAVNESNSQRQSVSPQLEQKTKMLQQCNHTASAIHVDLWTYNSTERSIALCQTKRTLLRAKMSRVSNLGTVNLEVAVVYKDCSDLCHYLRISHLEKLIREMCGQRMIQRHKPSLVIHPVKYLNSLSGHMPSQGQPSSIYCASTFLSSTPAPQWPGPQWAVHGGNDYSDNDDDDDSDGDEY